MAALITMVIQSLCWFTKQSFWNRLVLFIGNGCFSRLICKHNHEVYFSIGFFYLFIFFVIDVLLLLRPRNDMDRACICLSSCNSCQNKARLWPLVPARPLGSRWPRYSRFDRILRIQYVYMFMTKPECTLLFFSFPNRSKIQNLSVVSWKTIYKAP